MAVFVPVANVVKCAMSGTVAGKPWAHVFHFGYTGAPPSSNSLQIGCQALVNSWTAHMTPLQFVNVFLTQAAITDLSSTTGSQAAEGVNVNGTMNGAPVPNNAAMLISKKINRRYRGGHPRAYLVVGESTVMQTGAAWQGTFVQQCHDGYSAFMTANNNGGLFTGSTYEVTVHYKYGHVALVPPIVDQVQSYSADARIASQRRRIGK